MGRPASDYELMAVQAKNRADFLRIHNSEFAVNILIIISALFIGLFIIIVNNPWLVVLFIKFFQNQ